MAALTVSGLHAGDTEIVTQLGSKSGFHYHQVAVSIFRADGTPYNEGDPEVLAGTLSARILPSGADRLFTFPDSLNLLLGERKFEPVNVIGNRIVTNAVLLPGIFRYEITVSSWN